MDFPVIPEAPFLDRLPPDIILRIIEVTCREDQYEHDGLHQGTGDDDDGQNVDSDANVEGSEDEDEEEHRCNDDCIHVTSSFDDELKCTADTVLNCTTALYHKHSMTIRDILSLRATCKGTARSLVGWFRKQFPNCRLGRTGLGDVSMTPAGIRSFHTSSTSSIIADAIRSLHINVGEYVAAQYFEGYVMEPLTWKHAGEFKDFFLDGGGFELLRDALTRLPNLQEVYIGKWKAPFRILDDALYEGEQANSWEGYLGPRVMYDATMQGAGRELRTDVVKGVLEALVLSGRSISKLDIQSGALRPLGEEAGIWGLDLPGAVLAQLGTCFENLRRVHLTMSFGQDRYSPADPDTLPAGFTNGKGLRHLLRFLEAAPRMESLHLAASGDNVLPADFVDGVLGALPPSLTALHLFNALLSVPVLCRFLDARRRRLAEVGLCRCFLADESWTPVFRMLAVYLPRLRRVFLEQLWELHPRFGDKLFFGAPRDYEGGSFPDGEWRHAVRYDALVVRDDADRQPGSEIQYVHADGVYRNWVYAGVSEGLKVAITEARREACGYRSRDVDDPLPRRVLEHVCRTFGTELKDFVTQPKRRRAFNINGDYY